MLPDVLAFSQRLNCLPKKLSITFIVVSLNILFECPEDSYGSTLWTVTLCFYFSYCGMPILIFWRIWSAAAEIFHNDVFLQCLNYFDWIIRWHVAIWSFNCTKEKDGWVLEVILCKLRSWFLVQKMQYHIFFLHCRRWWSEKEEDQVWYRYCTIFCFEEPTWPGCKPERRAGLNFSCI